MEDRASAPLEPPPERLRDFFFEELPRIMLGLLRARSRRLFLGPLLLLGFGPPERVPGGWRWPIEGGLLARAAGGTLEFAWRDGQLVGRVDGYRPLLPADLYRLTQLPFHHLTTRLYLLRLRGPEPAPAVPAAAAERWAAFAVDGLLCLGLVALLRPRRRLPALAGLAAAGHLAGWALAGRTPGERLLGLRVAAYDGRPPSLGQALLRLLGGGRYSATGLYQD